MKRALRVLFCGSVFLACERPAPPPAAAPTEEAIVATGAAIARQLRENLVRRLTAVLDSGGPVAAIDVCADEALVLTDSIARSAGPGIVVRRTSERVRNPANEPDARDREALAAFRAELDAGRALPAHLVQQDGEGGPRYYEPLVAMPLCVQCHGPADGLDAGVRRVLAERYPADRATGYDAGDFRGLIRVGLPPVPRGTP